MSRRVVAEIAAAPTRLRSSRTSSYRLALWPRRRSCRYLNRPAPERVSCRSRSGPRQPAFREAVDQRPDEPAGHHQSHRHLRPGPLAHREAERQPEPLASQAQQLRDHEHKTVIPERRRRHDGRRSEFREFAESCGCGYLTRTDNKGAKAGNINQKPLRATIIASIGSRF